MKTIHTIARLVALLSILIGLLNTIPAHVYSSADDGYKAPAVRHDLARVKKSYARIPLSFVANYGQADKKVKFISRGSGYSLALAPTTFTLTVADSRHKESASPSVPIMSETKSWYGKSLEDTPSLTFCNSQSTPGVSAFQRFPSLTR